MKIWFGATSREIHNQIHLFRKITAYIKDCGCVVLFDWIEDAYNWKINHSQALRNIKNVYNEVIQAVSEADACVIEYTVPNFSSSHQIMSSVQQKKPTLVMRLNNDNSFADSYLDATAIDNKNLVVRNYREQDYKEVLDEFIGFSKLEQGLQRYNIVLDKKHKQYLDWAASKYGQSKSLIIRKAVEELFESDEDYKRYILGFSRKSSPLSEIRELEKSTKQETRK